MTFKISVCLDFQIDQNPNTNGIPLNCDSSLRMSKDEGMQLNAQVKHFSHHESTNLFEVPHISLSKYTWYRPIRGTSLAITINSRAIIIF